jgi:hypothetical protein
MKRYIFTTIFLFSVYFTPFCSYGAEMFFSTEKEVFLQNEDFLVQVFLNTEGSQVNAVEGKVKYPADNLEFIENMDGNSLVNFWIEKPHLSNRGEISFSGITTGGFSGEKIFLFGFVLKPKRTSDNMISFSNIRVLENDGIGTELTSKSLSLSVKISKDTKNGDSMDDIYDKAIPEDFSPEVGNDPSIFGGQHFVVFSTVDKISGIDHYEVREGFFGEYVISNSPHLLMDQSLSKNIYIKAVDKSGNERVVKINARHPFGLELYIIIGIIMTICILFGKKILRKFSR